MDYDNLKELLQNVKDGKTEIDDALEKLKKLPYEDLGYAKIDHHRNIRNGYPEVIYSQGKTIQQIKGIVERLMIQNNNIMATRAGLDVLIIVLKI